MRTGDFTRAERVLDEALEAAHAAGDRRAWSPHADRSRILRTFTKPEGSVDEIADVADEIIPLLEDLHDDLGLAKAWWLKSEVHVNACRWGMRAANLERALGHARKAGDAHEFATLAAQLVQAFYYGPMPVDEAIARCQELLAERPDDRSLSASITGSTAGLNAMRGDLEQARLLQAKARALDEQFGQRLRIAARAFVSAEIEALAGQPRSRSRSCAGRSASCRRWASPA